MSTMYARREPDGFYTMRQERYRAALAAGKEHPHDVCATAPTVDALRRMDAAYDLWPDADYSAVESKERPSDTRNGP